MGYSYRYRKNKRKIENSTIHIGFTKDEKGNCTIPRVAYFEVPDYKGDRIEKVIGLWENQAVEPELQSIVDRIIFFSKSGKNYLSRQNDHQTILTIYNKFQNEETLTKEDLEFLYELDKVRTYNISGDYRIKEILKSRDKKRDLMFVFGCQEKEISLGKGMKYVARVDAFPETTKYHIGKIEICQELKWMQEKDLDSKNSTVNLPKELVVGRIIARTDFIRNINFSKKLIGDLVLTLVKQISKITFPEEVIGDIYLNNISDLSEPMVLPRKLKGNLWLSSLKKEDLRWVTLPEEMEGEISFNASYLRWSLAGLKKIQQELITKEEPSEEISKNPKKR